MFRPTELRVGEVPVRAHLLDLSETGALAHAERLLEPGMRVAIRCAGAFRPAEVAWTDGRRFGVRFDRPLSTEQVDAVLHAQRNLIAEGIRRIQGSDMVLPAAGSLAFA